MTIYPQQSSQYNKGPETNEQKNEEWLKAWGMFSLKSRRPWDDMITSKESKSLSYGDRVELFRVVPEDKTRLMSLKTKKIGFGWISGKKLMVRSVQQ